MKAEEKNKLDITFKISDLVCKITMREKISYTIDQPNRSGRYFSKIY